MLLAQPIVSRAATPVGIHDRVVHVGELSLTYSLSQPDPTKLAIDIRITNVATHQEIDHIVGHAFLNAKHLVVTEVTNRATRMTMVQTRAPAGVRSNCSGCSEAYGLVGNINNLGCADGDAVCAGVNIVGDEAVGAVCIEMGCPVGKGGPPGLEVAYPGSAADFPGCQDYSCVMSAAVDNGGGSRRLLSLGSDTYWVYPPNAYATSNGAATSEIGGGGWFCQTTTSCGNAGANVTSTLVWTDYASDRAWAPCSAHVEYYVTAVWDDYSIMSTPLYHANKTIPKTNCPGYTTYVP